jgi:hypothetical protein
VAGLDNGGKAAFGGHMAKHPKRPRDFSQAAKLVVDIAAGDVTEHVPKQERSASGAKGGMSRALRLTTDQRKEAARLAAKARWRKKP